MSEEKCKKSPYVSCIRFGGRPILPPVMFPERIVEMQKYKQLAIQKEVELMARKRERHKRTFVIQENVQTAPSPKKCALLSVVDYHNSMNEVAKCSDHASFLDSCDLKVRELWSGHFSRKRVGSNDEKMENAVVNSIVNAFSEHLTIQETSRMQCPTEETLSVDLVHNFVKNEEIDEALAIRQADNFNCVVTGDENALNNDICAVVRKMSIASLTDEDDMTLAAERSIKSAPREEHERTKVSNNAASLSPVPAPQTCHELVPACIEGSWLAVEVDAEDRFNSPGAIVMQGVGHSYVADRVSVDSGGETVYINVNSDTPTVLPSVMCTNSVFTDTTPPSLASTNLAKYLHHTSPDNLVNDTFRPGTSTSLNTSVAVADLPVDSSYSLLQEGFDSTSGNSTVRAISDCNSEIKCAPVQLGESSVKSPAKRSAEDEETGMLSHQQQKLKSNAPEEPRFARVRRSSYTLECPSPALVAHVQLCEEQGISMVDDMTSMSSLKRNSVLSLKGDGEVKSIDRDTLEEAYPNNTDVLRLPSEDMDVVNENKQRHLENYLHNLSRYSGDEETLKSFPLRADSSSVVNLETAMNDVPNAQVPEMPETPRPPKLKSYEDMLRDQALYIEQLTLKLKEEHRRQMALLMAQQEEDLSYFQHDVMGTDGHIQTTRTESLDAAVVTPSTSTAVSGYVDLGEKSGKGILDDLAVAHKYQLLLHVKSPKVIVPAKASDPSFAIKYEYVSARVKGFLTRRLLRTERVQGIIKTIRDTLEFALYFHAETPIKTGKVTPAEANLHKRILMQLTSACYDFHDIFFKLFKAEQMAIISHDRRLLQDRIAKENNPHDLSRRNLSSATLKALERKKTKSINDSSNAPVIAGRGRSKSAASWSSSPKRRKVSSESVKVAVVKTTRPRTSSPRLISRSGTAVLKNADQRSFRNARRNLSSIYSPEAKHLPNDGRTFRSLRPLSTGASASFSLSRK